MKHPFWAKLTLFCRLPFRQGITALTNVFSSVAARCFTTGGLVMGALCGICVHEVNSQTGCTDPQALNFDPTATQNDGSCSYPTTFYSLKKLSDLPEILAEVSGFCFADNRFWAHTDGGNGAYFYQMQPSTGAVLKTVHLQQASNEDWEDMTTDGLRIFIGDFGNNASGNRNDLTIYSIPIAAIGNNASVSIQAGEWQRIPFFYENQHSFAPQPIDSIEFDCEAMIYFDNKLHLFSKNWKKRNTTHFVLDHQAAVPRAQPAETFDVQGLITSAAVSPDKKLVALLGYNKSPLPNVFVWLLWDFHSGLFFNGNKRRLELGLPISVGQSEAIEFLGNTLGYIGNEKLAFGSTTLVPQRIWQFDFKDFLTEKVNTHPARSWSELATIFPNPFSQHVDIQFDSEQFVAHCSLGVQVYNLLGELVFSTENGSGSIDTSTWATGMYIFNLKKGTQSIMLRGVKN